MALTGRGDSDEPNKSGVVPCVELKTATEAFCWLVIVSQYAVEAYPFEIMQGIRSAAFSVLLR